MSHQTLNYRQELKILIYFNSFIWIRLLVADEKLIIWL